MIKKIIKLILISTSFIFINGIITYAGNDVVKIKSFANTDKVYAGSEFKLAIKTSIGSGWHINSDKPHDSFLIPTKLTIEADSSFRLTKTIYPNAVDIKLDFSDGPLSVWTGDIAIGGIIQTAKIVKPGTYKL